VFERRVRVASLAIDDRQLAVQERAIGRAGDRALVRADGLVRLAGPRGLARGANRLLQTAELQDLDLPPQIGEGRVGDGRRFECGGRVGIAVQRQEGSAATNEGGGAPPRASRALTKACARSSG